MKRSLWQLGALCALLFSSCTKKDDPAPPPVPKGVIVFSSHVTNADTKDAIGVYDVEKQVLLEHNYMASGLPDNYHTPRLAGNRALFYFYGNSDIYSSSLDGSVLTNISRTPDVDESFPVPSPDGSKILYIVNDGNNLQLWTMNADGSGRKQISNFTNSPRFETMVYPQWVKDGKTVLFSAYVLAEKWNIYSFTIADSRIEKLTYSTDKNLLATDVSVDGKRILYVSTSGRLAEVHSMNIDGSGDRKLTNFGRTAADAAWSPDGNFISFVSDHELPVGSPNTDLYLMKADGTEMKRLTNTGTLKWDTHWK